MPKMVSLPQLPYSVTELHAYDCISLERLDCSFRNPGIRLIFAGCYKLNKEARDLIIHTRTNDYAVLPGVKVPECFTYRASGSSLTLKLNHKPLRTSMKFKACILLARKDYEFGDGEEETLYGYGEEVKVHCSITSKQNVTAFTLELKSYPKHLYIFEVEAEEVTSTKLVFEFEPCFIGVDTLKIKECGVMQLLEVPSCDEQNNKRFRDGDEDSDMERQILKPKSAREPSGEKKWWR